MGLVDATRAADLVRSAGERPDHRLNARQLTELRWLVEDVLRPIRSYFNEPDYRAVLASGRTTSGTVCPRPIVLQITSALAARLPRGQMLNLRDSEGMLVAVVTVEDSFRIHPEQDAVCVAGEIEAVELPRRYDYVDHRHMPQEAEEWARKGSGPILALDSARVPHRADHAALLAVAERLGGARILLQTVTTSDPELQSFRMRCHLAFLDRLPPERTYSSLLEMPPSGDPVRDAQMRAVLARRYQATHYLTYSLKHTFELSKSIGMEAIAVPEMGLRFSDQRFVALDDLRPNETLLMMSDEELADRLARGTPLPEWFTFPKVAQSYARRFPPASKRGLTVFFTGLSGSGKSTIAQALAARLRENDTRPVTLLDGDIVRTHLSRGLTFSREDRDINVRRIGFVASEVTKNCGVAICAPIAPYSAARSDVRRMIQPLGNFLLVHVNTPLEECERRDRKGLYARARAGEIEAFTGISDPYEAPDDAEVVVDTTSCSIADATERVLQALTSRGWVTQHCD